MCQDRCPCAVTANPGEGVERLKDTVVLPYEPSTLLGIFDSFEDLIFATGALFFVLTPGSD